MSSLINESRGKVQYFLSIYVLRSEKLFDWIYYFIKHEYMTKIKITPNRFCVYLLL